MTAPLRNVEVDVDTDLDRWPFEAIQALVERGSLTDWRRLAAAIRAQPWGPCARAVETITSWRELDGVDSLLATAIRRAREHLDAEGRRRYGQHLRELRRSVGMSQREFASVLGTSAPRLSSYERGQVAPTSAFLGRAEQVAEDLQRRTRS